MVVMSGCGHYVHEDIPDKVETVRNKTVKDISHTLYSVCVWGGGGGGGVGEGEVGG